MFFPGETITHKFVLPFDAAQVAEVTVSYKQNEGIIMELTFPNSTDQIVSESTGSEVSCSISHTFTQDESLVFENDMPFTIQLNVLTTKNTRHTSHILNDSNGEQYLPDIMT